MALIAVLALGLRLYGAGAESYWVDEAFSVIHIREGLGRIFAAGFSYETNPPLYYTLLWAWVAVFGDGEFATRSLSAIFGALTVPVIAATGRVLAGARAGCLAALLFALSVIEIEHGHETRQYALMALALSIALLGMAKALAERREDGAPPYGACAVFAGGIALAVYSHDVAVVYWFAMNLCLLVYLFASGHEKSDLPKAGRFLRSWAVCNLAALLLSSPQLYAIFVMREAPGVAWIPPIPAAWWIALWSFLRITLFSVLPWDGPITHIGLVAALAALGWAAIANRNHRLVLVLGLLLPFATLAVFMLISVFRPIMLARTLLWVPVPLYLLIGCAAQRIERAAWQGAAFFLAAGFQVAAIAANWTYFVKENWRGPVRLVADSAGPSDVIAFLGDGSAIPEFIYYWPGGFDAARCRVISDAVESQPSAGVRSAPLACPVASLEALLRDEVRQGRPAWFIARAANAPVLIQLGKYLYGSFALKGWEWASTRDTIMIVRVAAPN